MKTAITAFIFSALFALANPVLAAMDATEGLSVGDAWARATPGRTKNGAAYITKIVNHGELPDRLIAVSTPVAEMSSLHVSMMEGGVMKMKPIKDVLIAPGADTVLKPGATHIMMMGLNRPLKLGETFDMTLTFEKAGKVDIKVTVMKPGDMGPMGNTGNTGNMGDMDHGTMDHGKMHHNPCMKGMKH